MPETAGSHDYGQFAQLLRLMPDYAAVEAAIQALYHLAARVRTFLDFVAKRMREADVNRSCQREGAGCS